MSDDPNPNLRHDVGDWMSGPCLDPPLPPIIPPGSFAQRELLRAIGDALSLPPGINTIDDVRRLRLLDARAKLVTATLARILSDRESDNHDAMVAMRSLRQAVADCPPDYGQAP